MEEVYAYRVWDHRRSIYVPAPHKRTTEGIIACSGEIIPDTAESVPDELIDYQGLYRPRADDNDAHRT